VTPFLRYLLDENLRGVLWRAIQRHNALSVYAIDLVQVGDPPDLPLGSLDPDILLWAERQGRILVSLDKKTLHVYCLINPPDLLTVRPTVSSRTQSPNLCTRLQVTKLARTLPFQGISSVQAIYRYLENLASQAHPEGGWGYAPGQTSQLEPTCLALLALSLAEKEFEAAIKQGEAALQQCATEDGAYRRSDDRDELIWPTALVLFVQTVLDCSRSDRERVAARLLSVHAAKPNDQQAAEVHDIDLQLLGWPWAEGNFSWAEPTAWACLALRRAGFGDHARVREGLRLLIDRAFDDGGINYGNRTVLGRRTEPIPGPTALMLLALQGAADQPRIAAAVNYLLRVATTSDDLEHLCWAKLALDCYRTQPGVETALPGLDERIMTAYQLRAETPWLRVAPVREALTALALAPSEKNPFRLEADTVTLAADTLSYVAAPPAARRRPPWRERLAARFRGLAIDAAGHLRQIHPHTAVHIAKATDYNADLAGILQRQYEAFRQRVPLAGKRVVLKPNLVEYHRDKVINTHPHVVAAVIELCRREGAADIIVAEGPGHWRNVEYLVKASGLGDVLTHYRVPFVDLNHDEPIKMPNLGRLTRLDDLYLARTVTTAEVLISLPKLKTHHWAGATLSLKNLFGTMSGICYGWPKNELHWRGIDNSIVDIALTRPPDLAIVDGIIGMEGDGPLNGTPKPLGVLIMGCDPLAVDATGCRLMQLDPLQVGYLSLGYQKKLGLLQIGEIQQIGEPIADLAQPFDTVPHFHQLRVARSA
jgi:uncharacterized protein (DUF362 family)